MAVDATRAEVNGLVRRGHEDGPIAEAAEEAHAPTPVAREAYIKKLVLKRNL